ncbi:MAG: glycosyltransferase [Candidatus Hydrogenedentota bacterium]
MKDNPYLSIVFPVYNEESRLKKSLITISEFITTSDYPIELIFSNDGSTDKTAFLLETFKELFSDRVIIKILNHPRNRGKGAVVRDGMLAASGNWVMFTDVDIPIPLKTLDIIKEFENSKTDVILGRRKKEISKRKWYRQFTGLIFHLLTKLILPQFDDTQCPFKIFRKSVVVALFFCLKLQKFGFDLEILKKIRKKRLKFAQIDVPFTDVPGSKLHPLKTPVSLFIDLLKIIFLDTEDKTH